MASIEISGGIIVLWDKSVWKDVLIGSGTRFS